MLPTTVIYISKAYQFKQKAPCHDIAPHHNVRNTNTSGKSRKNRPTLYLEVPRNDYGPPPQSQQRTQGACKKQRSTIVPEVADNECVPPETNHGFIRSPETLTRCRHRDLQLLQKILAMIVIFLRNRPQQPNQLPVQSPQLNLR